MLISRERFARVLLVLTLFYKTYLLRLNLIVFSSPLDTSTSSPSIDKPPSLANPSSPLVFNSTFESLEDFLSVANSLIEISLSGAFANENKKEKKDKEREKERENKEIRDAKKKVNKDKEF